MSLIMELQEEFENLKDKCANNGFEITDDLEIQKIEPTRYVYALKIESSYYYEFSGSRSSAVMENSEVIHKLEKFSDIITNDKPEKITINYVNEDEEGLLMGNILYDYWCSTGHFSYEEKQLIFKRKNDKYVIDLPESDIYIGNDIEDIVYFEATIELIDSKIEDVYEETTEYD